MTFKRWRKQNKLTQKQAGEFLGVSLNTAKRWEKKEPTILQKYIALEEKYIKLEDLYMTNLVKNKSFKINQIGGNNKYALYVWGEGNWVLWKILPIQTMRKLGLSRNKRYQTRKE